MRIFWSSAADLNNNIINYIIQSTTKTKEINLDNEIVINDQKLEEHPDEIKKEHTQLVTEKPEVQILKQEDQTEEVSTVSKDQSKCWGQLICSQKPTNVCKRQ